MSNYTPTGNPLTSTRGISSLVRTEFALIQTAIASKGDSAGQTWTGAHTWTSVTGIYTGGSQTYTGVVIAMAGATSVSVPTMTPADNTTNAASTAFVQATAFATALPSQTGNGGKFVTTNGVTASWAAIPPSTGSIIYSALTQGAF